MTQPPPPFPSQPPPAPNPTAQAAARKAYANASRPWFQKKRFLIPIAAVVLIGIGGALGESEDRSEVKVSDSADSSAPQTTPDAASGQQVQAGTAGAPVPPGTSVQNKSAKYTVTGVDIRDSLSQFSSPPGGTWVVVSVAVENVKNETIQISSSDFTLEVNGFSIDASTEAFYLDDAFGYDDLSPTLAKSGVVVFDVPADVAGQGVLRSQALFSSDEAVYLSLV